MNQIIRARYQANNGQYFVTGINSELTTQTSGDPAVSVIGWTAPVATDLPLPRQMKPRRAVCYNPAGKRREIILLSPTALLGTVGQTINVEDSDGAETTYTCEQVKGEEFRKRRKAAAV